MDRTEDVDQWDDAFVYKVSFGDPRCWTFGEGFFDGGDSELDLPDPYPFMVSPLPQVVHDRYPDPYRNAHHLSFQRLKDLGVRELVWRTPPRQLHYTLLSSTVFEELSRLSPGFYDEDWRFAVSTPDGKDALTYVLPKHTARPLPPSTISGDVGDVPAPGPEFAAFLQERKVERVKTVLTVDSAHLGQGLFDLAHFPYSGPLATADFIRNWRATELSQHLRTTNFEHDMFFEPFDTRRAAVQIRVA